MTIETQDDSRKLQEGLDLLYRWSIRWRLNFNIKKCDCVNITRKKYPANHVYSLGGKNLRKTDSQQDLGLLISSNAKFSKHGSKVINKANSMLGLLKRNCSSKHFSVRARRLLYLALVRTHLDYASEAWSGQSLNITSAIERGQRRATNYILGIPSRSVSYKERLSRTNLLPLTYWHEIKDLLFIHGCLNGKLSDLWNLLPKRTIAAGAITTSLYQDLVQNIFNKVFLLDPVDCGILSLKNLD